MYYGTKFREDAWVEILTSWLRIYLLTFRCLIAIFNERHVIKYFFEWTHSLEKHAFNVSTYFVSLWSCELYRVLRILLDKIPLFHFWRNGRVFRRSDNFKILLHTIKPSNFGPLVNFGFFFFQKGLLSSKSVLQKNEEMMIWRNEDMKKWWKWRECFCSSLIHNSSKEATELARKGLKFQWGPKLETFTVQDKVSSSRTNAIHLVHVCCPFWKT
jgi:hypothetical protein